MPPQRSDQPGGTSRDLVDLGGPTRVCRFCGQRDDPRNIATEVRYSEQLHADVCGHCLKAPLSDPEAA
jgi:hypothetical protein